MERVAFTSRDVWSAAELLTAAFQIRRLFGADGSPPVRIVSRASKKEVMLHSVPV